MGLKRIFYEVTQDDTQYVKNSNKDTITIVLVDIGKIYLGGQTNNWNIFNIDGIKYNRRDKVQII